MKNNKQIIVAAHQEYSGPLPPAEDLCRYNDACPDAANRIITMAEEQARHRRLMEQTEQKNRVKISMASMFYSTLCVFVLSGVIVFAIYMNATGAAIATSISAIASVAGIFLYHKKKQ